MTNHVTSFDEIKDQFDTYIGDIVYATMTTVDQKGRPRARVLIPVCGCLDAAKMTVKPAPNLGAVTSIGVEISALASSKLAVPGRRSRPLEGGL